MGQVRENFAVTTAVILRRFPAGGIPIPSQPQPQRKASAVKVENRTGRKRMNLAVALVGQVRHFRFHGCRNLAPFSARGIPFPISISLPTSIPITVPIPISTKSKHRNVPVEETDEPGRRSRGTSSVFSPSRLPKPCVAFLAAELRRLCHQLPCGYPTLRGLRRGSPALRLTRCRRRASVPL